MYDHKNIDKKWQNRWKDAGIFHAKDNSKKQKFYCLVEFPYPSGAGLHVGHPRSYTALDVIARKRRMEGFNVLYPIGWDAFGLPTENYAIKTGRTPQDVTKENIATFKRQLQSLGFSFDWSREINTTDPEYYKWTQWMFLEFYKAGLAYKAKMPINWCKNCKIGLANEEVVNGACERCGGEVEKREKEQWMIAITKYADRLIADLDDVQYLEKIKKQQIDWIGKSEGAEIRFVIASEAKQSQSEEIALSSSTPRNDENVILVFTTRPDTIFGATYMVLAPEHPLVSKITIDEKKSEVEAYINEAKGKTEIERGDATKEKTGVFTGSYAVNPANGEKIPVWIADYVLMGYGTGAIMAVPAHDERDFAFAKQFDLPVRQVIAPDVVMDGAMTPRNDKETTPLRRSVDAIIENDRGEILLQIEDDQVHFPGGGVEEGESSEEALAREIREETGYINFEIDRVIIDHIFGLGYRIPKDKNQHGDATHYYIRLQNEEKVPCEIEEGKHTQEWVPKSEVAKRLNWNHHSLVWSIVEKGVYTGEGLLVNSLNFNGITNIEAAARIIEKLEKDGVGRATTNYKLRDWVFSRQRYWGEPIPLVNCEKCGWVPIPESELPLELPVVEKYEPTENGESPLATMHDWVNTKCPQCGDDAKRETDTMPNWAGSSWYFLRYMDAKNSEAFADKDKLKYWAPVDWYNGGMEHTTLHLLYSRFWNKFLFDRGHVPVSEPYLKRTSHGLVLAEDGSKMSKSKGNVVNPDEIVSEFGADSLRVYELFMGPFAEPVPWSTNGLIGVRKFLDRVMRLPALLKEEESVNVTRLLHQSMKKITDDIEAMRFNTAVSQMMIFVNEVMSEKGITKESFTAFLRLLVPFAPHVANELFEEIKGDGFLESQSWPEYNLELALESELNIAVQVNGKLRGTISVLADATEEEIVSRAKADENVAKFLFSEPKKIIYVKGKLVSFVV